MSRLVTYTNVVLLRVLEDWVESPSDMILVENYRAATACLPAVVGKESTRRPTSRAARTGLKRFSIQALKSVGCISNDG